MEAVDPRQQRHDNAVARASALRQRIAAIALGIASVETELAATLDQLARRDVRRGDELRARAARARRYAEAEREAARHLTN